MLPDVHVPACNQRNAHFVYTEHHIWLFVLFLLCTAPVYTPVCVVAGASSWFFGAIQFPSAYSNPSAPGLLMASGNVAGEGYGLDDNDG